MWPHPHRRITVTRFVGHFTPFLDNTPLNIKSLPYLSNRHLRLYGAIALIKNRSNLIMDETAVHIGGRREPGSAVDTYMKTFLRLKGDVRVSPLYSVEGNVFSCEIPQSQLPKHAKNDDVLYKKYTFSKIFESQVAQTELFQQIVQPKIFDLMNGRNSSLLAYGASGSGKTYTMVGTESEPGLIPRALEYLFRSLPALADRPKVQAMEGGYVRNLSSGEQMHAQQVKAQLIALCGKMAKVQMHKETYKKMQRHLSEQPTATVYLDGANVAVAVWISFVEIYNETIYDLLKSHTKTRTKLVLGTHKNAPPHIKGLSSVFVSTGVEAYQVLKYGLTNVNYAPTALNDRSSRSHCIFTIKLVQSGGGGGGGGGRFSTFNFCDLAGSERLKKSHNVGDRLQESKNINTSLFVLGRCLKEVRDSQKHKDSRTVPFRDSKLTQLLQYAISGRENVSIIVNVNPSDFMYPETQHVLNFSAVAMEVKVEQRPPEAVPEDDRPVEGAEAANESVLHLEQLLKKMQQHLRQYKEQRSDQMSEYVELLVQQANGVREHWQQRVNEHPKVKPEAVQGPTECFLDWDAGQRLLDDIRQGFNRELSIVRGHVRSEKRNSQQLLARVVQLESDADLLAAYNRTVIVVDSSESD